MRLVLVDNLLLPEKGDIPNLDVHPHLGLLSLVAVAEEGGHEATIFDPKWPLRQGELRYDASLYREVAERLIDLAPDAVGFTTLGCSFIFSAKVARYLKRHRPELPILLGGPHATILHETVLERFGEFDAVVRHEAEGTLLPVLDGLGRGDLEGIPGVTWRRDGKIVANPGMPTVEDLDSLPFPGWEHYPVDELGLTALRVDAGRGCPFSCTFCSTASFFGRQYRLKSPGRLVGELDWLHETYGITDFKLNHDLFTVDKRKVRAFCEAVNGRGYTWGVSARVDCVDEALLEEMRAAGCTGIYFGIETGSRRMQKISDKHLDLDLVDPILDVTERLGMRTIVSFIAGYPEELPADQADTLDAVGACFKRDRRLFTTQLHMLTPEPGTGLAREYGDRLQYDGYLTDFNAAQLEDDDEEIIRGHSDVFLTYFYYPTQMPRARHIFAVEAYRTLRRAGHTILRYALRFYGGRFSRLVEHLREWSEAQRLEQPPDVASVVRYFGDVYGAEHHLTSLFRWSLETERTRKLGPRVGEAEREPSPLDHDQALRLGPAARLFRNLHNCHDVVARIRADEAGERPLDTDELGGLGDYLTVGRGTVDGGIENYALEPETYAVLSLFEHPRSYREVCEALASVAAEARPESAFFERMISLGVLVPEGVAAAAGREEPTGGSLSEGYC